MNPTSREALQEAIDKALGRTPGLNRFGQEGRDQRDLQRSVNAVELADNTAGVEKSLKAVATGNHPELLGYRPTVGVDKLDAAGQQKVFDANLVTKKEGPAIEVEKKAIAKVQETLTSKLETVKAPPAKWEVSGLKKLDTNATTKFDKADYFEAAKVNTLLDLNPENLGEFTGTPLKAVDTIGANTDLLLKGIYGEDFLNKLDTLLNQRLSHTGSGSQDILASIKLVIEGSAVATPPIVHPSESAELLKQAVKIALLQNPESISANIAKLADNGEIDLFSIPGVKDVLQKRIVKETVDRFAARSIDYFNPGTGAVTDSQAKANRRLVLNQINTGSAGTSITLTKTSGTLLLPVSQITAGPAFTRITGTDLKIDAASATDQQATVINAFKNNAYRGLYADIAPGQVKSMAELVSKTLSKNQGADTKVLFTDLVSKGLVIASNEGKTPLDRLAAFANMRRICVEKAGSLTGTKKTTLEAVTTSLKEFGSPAEVVSGLKKGMLDEFVSKLSPAVIAASPMLVGLDTAALTSLKTEIAKATDGSAVLPNHILERLSMIAAGVSDDALRAEMFNSLRAVTTVEALNEIAARAAESDTNVKYDQYVMALLNRFVLKDGGATPEQLATELNNIFYGKGKDEEALKLVIDGNPALKAYLTAMHGGGVTYEANLELKGFGSTGASFARTHELFGIVRRGAEMGEWAKLAILTDVERKQYLVDTFGMAADDPATMEALKRFNELLTASAATGQIGIIELFEKACKNESSNYGDKYTNIARMFRRYIVEGGDLKEIMRNEQDLQVNKFMNAIQTQANPELGAKVGDVMTESNRVLTIEEQRAAVLENYNALSGKAGIKTFFQKLKTALPRIAKAAAFMVAGTVLGAVPVFGGIALAGFAALRVFSTVKVVQAGIPLIKDAWARGDSKMAMAAGLGIGVNVLVSSLFPSPLSSGLLLLGETIGTIGYEMKSMKAEAEMVKKAHNVYEAAWKTHLGALVMTNPADKEYLQKVARSVNQDLIMSITTPTDIDVVATVAAIVAKRDAAHTEHNMTLLRSFSEVMEERVTTQADNVRNTNSKARELKDESQKVIMSYALASSATKLGFGITRGAIAGFKEGGVFGGLLGAVGIQSLDRIIHPENAQAAQEQVPNESVTQLQSHLENQFDTYAQQHGIDASGNNVVGIVETADGHQYAAIDLDGNPNSIESMIPLNGLDMNNISAANLDFSGVNTTGETGGTTTETLANSNEYIAQSNDSQWSMVSKVLHQAYPNLDQHQLDNKTANILNEAGRGKVYEQIFAHRDEMGVNGGGTVVVGDKITIADIKNMAPHEFDKIVAITGADHSTTATVTTTETGGIESATTVTTSTLPLDQTIANNATGIFVFNSQYGPAIAGEIDLGAQPAGVQVGSFNDDNSQASSATANTTVDTEQDSSIGDRLKDLLFGANGGFNKAETGGANADTTVRYDTFTVKDPGFGNNYQVDESQVAKIIVPGAFQGMNATEIDPKLVDVVNVSSDGVTYIDGSGQEVTVQALHGVQFDFVGNTGHPVDISAGETTVLSNILTTTNEAVQSTSQMVEQTQQIEKSAQQVNDNLRAIDTNLSEIFHLDTLLPNINVNPEINIDADKTFETWNRVSEGIGAKKEELQELLQYLFRDAGSTGSAPHELNELKQDWQRLVPGTPLPDDKTLTDFIRESSRIESELRKMSPIEPLQFNQVPNDQRSPVPDYSNMQFNGPSAGSGRPLP